jgi:uncharacterized membrane protein YbhN (UPF0104 family)
MHPPLHFSTRHLLLSLGSIGALIVIASSPQLLGDRVGAALGGVLAVSPVWLWAAALAFVTSLAASGCAWRSALARCGGDLSRTDAAARYGVGSLLNALAPAKLGSAVRFALFSRTLEAEGRLWTTGGVAASVGAARAIWLALLLLFAAASGVLPLWPLAVLAGVLALAVAVALVARDTRPNARAAHALDAFRALRRSPRAAAELVGWVGIAAAARVGAATAIAAAFGVDQPLLAALLVVPALDLAGLLQLTPGNIGVASAAIAFALHAHGVGSGTALSAGIAFSAVETATSLAFGTGSALFLFAGARTAPRWSLAAVGATACVGLAAAFGATVVLPLV